MEWVCEPPPPAAPVGVQTREGAFAGFIPQQLGPPTKPVYVWVCDGICAVVNVVAPADNPDVVIVGVWLVKQVENAEVPPEDAAPETTLKALSLCVVCLVQPVGAAVC